MLILQTSVSILLAVAKILSKWREKLKGTVKFCFQLAETGPIGALIIHKLFEENK